MGDGVYRTLDTLYLADANGGPRQHNLLLGQENAPIPMPVLVTVFKNLLKPTIRFREYLI